MELEATDAVGVRDAECKVVRGGHSQTLQSVVSAHEEYDTARLSFS